MGAKGNKCLWNGKGDVLLPGGFQPDPMTPPDKTWADDAYANVWLTIGGANVGSQSNTGDCLNVQKQLGFAEGINANGFNFDMEGCLAQYIPGIMDKIKVFIQQVKEKHPDKYTFVYVPAGGATEPVEYDDSFGFDYVAPMQYGGPTSYQPGGGYSQDQIKGYMQKWVSKGWKPSMTFVTYQSVSANADDEGKETLKFLCKKTLTDGYKGILGWPSPSLDANSANQDLLRNAGC